VAELAKVLIALGLLLVVTGVVVLCVGRVPFLGRLPGDIAVQRDGFGLYFPIVTCVLASIVLTLLLSVGTRLFHR
jgi:ABC-type enterochelin transport system permease subunit